MRIASTHSLTALRKFTSGMPSSLVYISRSIRTLTYAARQQVLNAPLEPIISPSKLRIQIVGVTILIGQPLYYMIWAFLLPEPYENLWLRMCMMIFGAMLLMPAIYNRPYSRTAARVFSLVTFANLPFFFWFMYFANHGDAVWLASVTAMIFFYYTVIDWRLATLGVAAGLIVGGGYWAYVSSTAEVTGDLLSSWPVHLFSWISGIVLGLSAANTRRARLLSMLSTMGIMAHELRTPLATISIIGQALGQRINAVIQPDASTTNLLATAAQMRPQVERIAQLVRLMNHQIDTQISNSSLLVSTGTRETVGMAEIVNEAVQNYPFTDTSIAQSVQASIRQDFNFMGSRALTRQVVSNLLKNAVRALISTQRDPQAGDIVIEVNAQGGFGQLVVEDRGVGMPSSVYERIFEPFFTTHESSGHGLGLMFCKQVIQRANGSIRVESQLGVGTRVVIRLPVIREQS
jgi:two-component system, CAI-1 autoinducer sensor kinase/phosphatase CqsS